MRGGWTYVKKLTEEQKQACVAEYLRGDSISMIADRYKVDRSTVWSLLGRRGVKMRKPHETNPRRAFNRDAFSTITEESAYWIGFLMADGSIAHRKSSFYFSLGISERSHVEKFREFLKSDHKISMTPGKGYANAKPIFRLSIASKPIVARLAKYGVRPRKNFNARVIGLENNRHFWRGVVDGDGYVSNRIGRYGRHPVIGLVGAKPLLRQFRKFIMTLTKTNVRVQPLHSIWSVCVSCHVAVPVIEALYSDCTIALDRKLTTAQQAIVEYREILEQRRLSRICSVPGCGDEVEARRYCRKHYSRHLKYGRTDQVQDRWHNVTLADD